MNSSMFQIRKIFIAILLFGFLNNIFCQKNEFQLNDQKLIQSLQIIKNAYVDSVNDTKIVEKGIIAMLKELDPHSVYLSKEELKEANEPLIGNFDGIGIEFNILHDTLVVISPITGGPSQKLGIMAGDKIIKIEGEDIIGKKLTNNLVFKKLRGAKGTKVNISIYRKGVKNLIDYTIVRDKIPLNSVDAVFMATKDIGYIRLTRFSQTSVSEFQQALKTLQEKGMKNLIFDLRNNAGGLLNAAIDISDEFLSTNKLIVYTEGLASPTYRYSSTTKGGFEKGKLVILIDEGSASASEIVSGAVQDWDRGIIIGRRSFGKGLVQRPFDLVDGSSIRLTTARYHTPTGRCIQKPYNEGTDKYFADLSTRYKKGEFINPDSIHFPDSLKYYTPNKRIVFGGGGIMPDIFIPIDTSNVSDFYVNLNRKAVLIQFPIQYVDDNRNQLKSDYPTLDDYIKKFTVTDSIFASLLDFAEKAGVKKNDKQIETSKKLIQIQVKALIGRNLWGVNAYVQIMSEADDALKKAIEVINSNMFKKAKISE